MSCARKDLLGKSPQRAVFVHKSRCAKRNLRQESNVQWFRRTGMEKSRKICMLGDFGVGKTSLVARFVKQTFSEKYITTVGVKIDSKVLENPPMKLVLWDIAGKNALDGVKLSYLQGASGVVLVADGTREATVRSALYLMMQAKQEVHFELPAVLLINKFDRFEDWEVTPAMIAEVRKNLPVFEASALTGLGVEAAFLQLAKRMETP